MDEAGLCRRVTLEARPRDGNLGLLYVPKDLEKFEMATQRLVLLHPHEAEIINEKDLSIIQDKVPVAAQDEEVPVAAQDEVPAAAQEKKET